MQMFTTYTIAMQKNKDLGLGLAAHGIERVKRGIKENLAAVVQVSKRTGVPAMVKFRLMDAKRWRIIEVELDHNHLMIPATRKFYKSHKHLGLGTKRTLQLDGPEEVHKIRLFRTVIIDAEANGSVDAGEEQVMLNTLKEGDAQSVHNFFCHVQLMDPNFFYLVDLNDKGCLRNLFWADARARAGYIFGM